MAKKTVSRRTYYATLAVAGVIIVGQFMWWNKKAPGVLKGKKY